MQKKRGIRTRVVGHSLRVGYRKTSVMNRNDRPAVIGQAASVEGRG